MALTLGDNFSYQGAKPLDGRLKYDTVAAMKAMADSTLYDGCLAYCVATGKTYQWKSTNTVDADLGRWREFESGQTITVDSAISGTSENPVQNKVIKGALDLKADLVDGKVPAAQLPAYVDDVLEYEDLAHFPATGETGKIYIAQDTNKTYRWSGTGYVEISESLALGETSSTAYRGDRGKAAYDISQTVGDVTNLTTTEKSSVVGAVNEVNGKIEYVQYSTLPTASIDNLGKIVQYIGATGGGYTNGYFYKCVSDGESTPTYSWSNINVQAGGGSGTEEIFVGTIDEWNALTTSQKESYSLVLIKSKEFVVGNVYTLNEKTFICAQELDDDVFALQANTSWGTVAYIRSGYNTGDRINVNLVDSYTQAANWYTSDVQAIEADDYKYGPHWVSVGDATSASYKYNDGLKAAYGWTGSSAASGNSHYAINSDGAAVSLDTAFSPRSAGLAPAFNVDATKAVIGLNNVVTAGTPEHIDHLYTYNSETGELESIPHRITSEEMSEIVSPLPAAQRVMPILFDETGAEYVVGWYKRASDGKKKPIYEKSIVKTGNVIGGSDYTLVDDIPIDELIYCFGYIMEPNSYRRYFPGEATWVRLTTDKKVILLYTNSGSYFAGTQNYTIRYTKTTDTWND